MHIIHFAEPLELLADKDTLPAGEYLMEDENAGQLMCFARRAEMRPVADMPKEKRGALFTSPEATSALFLRVGGYGDLILLTPVLREHKRQFPDARIGVCCFPPYAAVLENLSYVDEIVPYPLPLAKAYEWERWVFLEKAIECNPRAKDVHATDLFAEIAGVLLGEDRKADYVVRSAEALEAHQKFPRSSKRRACIHVATSARARNYPLALSGEVTKSLVDAGWEVFLIGEKGQLPPMKKDYPGIVNLTDKGLSFRQTAAIVNGCDVLIAPDSAFVHVAGALGVPCVALFGPFHWKLRTAYYPSVTALHGHEGCSPCWHHMAQVRQDHFPKHCPTRDKGYCGLMYSIEPARIVAKAGQIARNLVGSSL